MHVILIRLCQGFDEFMNLIVQDAVEVKVANKQNNNEETRSDLGTIGQ